MGTMVVIVLLILVVFNYYLSVAQDLPFKKRFGQMAGISPVSYTHLDVYKRQVGYVFIHYLHFFFMRIEEPKSAAVIRENKQTARFSEYFEN